MDLFTVTIGVSILVYIVIGSYAGRSVKELDDYFVAGRRAPTLLILGTLVASVMSTSIFMGEAAFTYDGQFGAYLLFPGIAVTGYMLGALFFGVYIRRSRAPTVADYFGHRFQSRRLQQFAGFTIILGLGGYLLIVTQGRGSSAGRPHRFVICHQLARRLVQLHAFHDVCRVQGRNYHRHDDVPAVHDRDGSFCWIYRRWLRRHQCGGHRYGAPGKQGGYRLLDGYYW